MIQPATDTLAFPVLGPVPLEVDFLAGRLTSDGGVARLAGTDDALELKAGLAAVIPDWRTRRGRHAPGVLVTQRVFQIARVYEDQHDAARLRTDPLPEHVCRRRVGGRSRDRGDRRPRMATSGACWCSAHGHE